MDDPRKTKLPLEHIHSSQEVKNSRKILAEKYAHEDFDNTKRALKDVLTSTYIAIHVIASAIFETCGASLSKVFFSNLYSKLVVLYHCIVANRDPASSLF